MGHMHTAVHKGHRRVPHTSVPVMRSAGNGREFNVGRISCTHSSKQLPSACYLRYAYTLDDMCMPLERAFAGDGTATSMLEVRHRRALRTLAWLRCTFQRTGASLAGGGASARGPKRDCGGARLLCLATQPGRKQARGRRWCTRPGGAVCSAEVRYAAGHAPRAAMPWRDAWSYKRYDKQPDQHTATVMLWRSPKACNCAGLTISSLQCGLGLASRYGGINRAAGSLRPRGAAASGGHARSIPDGAQAVRRDGRRGPLLSLQGRLARRQLPMGPLGRLLSGHCEALHRRLHRFVLPLHLAHALLNYRAPVLRAQDRGAGGMQSGIWDRQATCHSHAVCHQTPRS